MQKKAAEPHYNGERYIGIDKAILELPNVRLIDGDVQIDDELSLFSGITGRRCYPQGNHKLSRMENGKKVPDAFAHEQCLVIKQSDKRWLLSCCSHNGILNILNRYRKIYGNVPDYVITGFHMMKKDDEHTEEERAVIIHTAQELSQLDTVFYSGHCTGIPAFELMKGIMGDNLIALHSGEMIIEQKRQCALFKNNPHYQCAPCLIMGIVFFLINFWSMSISSLTKRSAVICISYFSRSSVCILFCLADKPIKYQIISFL